MGSGKSYSRSPEGGLGHVEYELLPDQLTAANREYPDILLGRMRSYIDAYMLEFVTNTLVTARLSGRPGLNRQSGHLAGNFYRDVAGETLAELTWVAYTPVKYARPHEPTPDGAPRSYTSSLGNVWTMPPRLQFRATFIGDAERRGSIVAAAARQAATDWAAVRGKGAG